MRILFVKVTDLDKLIKDKIIQTITPYVYLKYNTLPKEPEASLPVINTAYMKNKLDALVKEYFRSYDIEIAVDISVEDYHRVYLRYV